MDPERLADIRDEAQRHTSKGDVWELRAMLRELLAAYDPLRKTLAANHRAHRIEQTMREGVTDRIAKRLQERKKL